VIDAFVAGDDVDGVIFDAGEEASDVIIRQFQITTNGEWVKTDEIGQYKTTRTVPAPLSIGARGDSPNKENAVKHVQDAQVKLAELLEEKDAYDNFECG
jgi:hypothetical protein